MPEFKVDCKTYFSSRFRENRRTVWKLQLNYEWTVVFVLSPFGSHLQISLIEIHRKYNGGENAIFGELKVKLESQGLQIFHKTFSEIIGTGISFIKIALETSQNFCNGSMLSLGGFVNISDISKKCETISTQTEPLANESNEKLTTALTEQNSIDRNRLKSLDELSNHLEKLLEPQTSSFADVTLKCGSVPIPAHKSILAVRSPVFSAMFSNNMKESHLNEVQITDMEAPILQVLLCYMYTGKTNNLCESSASDLLFAADKYQLPGLKEMCYDVLKDTVSIQNVLKVLVLGDMYSVDLKAFAMRYICNNCEEFPTIEQSEEWKTLRTERPGLVIDVLTSFVNSRIKK